MNERPNDAEADETPFEVPVSWHPSEPFYPHIRSSNGSGEVGARRAKPSATQQFSRLVIVLTALVMALVFLTGKPCRLQSAAPSSPQPVRHGANAF